MRSSLLAKQSRRYCLNHSAGCPIIHDLRLNAPVTEPESDFIMGKNDYWPLGAGWYSYEAIPIGVRWTSAKAIAKIKLGNFRAIIIEAVTFAPELEAKPVSGVVSMNGVALGVFDFIEPAWKNLVYSIPEALRATREETGMLEIKVDRVFQPRQAGDITGDSRELGIAVGRIRMFGDIGKSGAPTVVNKAV